MGWSGHPIFGQGVARATPRPAMGVALATPDFHPFFSSLKKKKKKKKSQNDVVLGKVGVVVLKSVRGKIGIFCTEWAKLEKTKV
jgi:hypothetical protein